MERLGEKLGERLGERPAVANRRLACYSATSAWDCRILSSLVP